MARRPGPINQRYPEGMPRVGGVPDSGSTHPPQPPAPPAPPQYGPRTEPFHPTAYDPTSNPYYQSVAAAMNAAGAADAAQRRQNVQQALIQFGMVPEGFNDKYGDVDANTRSLIDKNTSSGISMYARLLDAKNQDRRALVNQLGAHGLFRSGAKGYGLRRRQLDYDRNLADSLATLMQQVGGFNSAYANNELGRQQSLANALAQAYASYVPAGPDWTPYAAYGNAAKTLAYYGGSGGSIRGAVSGGVR